MSKDNWDVEWTSVLPELSTSYSVSPTHCLTIRSKATLWYNGKIDIKNAYVYFYSYHTTHGEPESLMYIYMRMSSKTLASANGYLMVWNSYGLGRYYRYNAGVVTTLYSAAGGWAVGLGLWQKFRMSCITVAGNVVLKPEYWTGAAWSTGYTYTDSSASKILAGGYSGVAFGSRVYIDDVIIVEIP